MRSSRGRYFCLVFLAACVIYLPGTGRPLRDSEAKYAEIPREMLVLGDWLTPYLDYVRYYDKPPLTFWATAALYEVLGVSERPARLAVIFWAFLTAFLTGILAERMFDKRQGYLVSALFLFTAEVYIYCLDAGIEFGLISFVVLSLIFFWDFCRTGSLIRLGLFYLCLGLGFMSKGLPGVAIPGGVAFSFLLFQKNGQRLLRLFHPQALAVLVLTAGPWVALMLARQPDFFDVFVVNEHIHRFTGDMVSNDALFPTPLWLVLVTGEFFPWVFHMPHLGVYLFRVRGRHAVPREKVRFLLIWAALPLLIFSLSRSKVDFYGLHCYPPLIILLSLPLRDLLGSRRFTSPRSWSYPWFAISVLSLLAAMFLFLGRELTAVQGLGIPSLKVALVFLTTLCFLALGVAVSFVKGRVRLALIGIFALMTVFFHSTRVMFVIDFPRDSMKFAADTFNEMAEKRAILVSDERPEFEHVASLNFYTGRPVYLLRDREGSILHFIQKDREAMCLDEADLAGMRHEGRVVYLVGETEKTRERLSRLKFPYRILASAGERSLFRLEPERPQD